MLDADLVDRIETALYEDNEPIRLYPEKTGYTIYVYEDRFEVTDKELTQLTTMFDQAIWL